MQGPLHSSIYDTSDWQDRWWVANAPEWRAPPAQEDDINTDVAIVGGGFAGLSTAIGLAAHGIQATVLDAAPIGWGASGRNGGIVGFGSYKLSEAKMQRLFGADEMARYHDALADGVEQVRAFAEANDVPMQGETELILAHSERSLADLKAARSRAAATRLPFGPGAIAPMARLGGVRIGPCFGIQPLIYVRALAAHAAAMGSAVHPESEVTSWRKEGRRHLLETARGTVRADRLVMACNGFMLDNLHPALAGRAVPVISQIGVTRPLTDDERAQNPWLGDDPVATTKNLLYYIRLLPEGRLLFGQRDRQRGSPRDRAAGRRSILKNIRAAFAGLDDIEVDYHWNGPICATRAMRPAVGPIADDPSVFHAFGWHGSGINAAQTAGRLLAEAIATGSSDTLPAPIRGLPPRVPLPGLRPLYVKGAILRQMVEDQFN